MARGVPFWFSSRMFTALMCFTALLFMYLLRFNMSVGIVCMVNDTANGSPDEAMSDLRRDNDTTKNSTVDTILFLHSGSNASDVKPKDSKNYVDEKPTVVCGEEKYDSEDEERKDGPFLWSKYYQGLILSAYFWGYVIFMIPSGWLANRYNNVRILGISIALSSCLCLAVPSMAYLSPIVVICSRVLMGSLASFIFPCVQNLLNRWIPPGETAGLSAFVFSGVAVGNLVSFFSSGFLCEYGFADGWQSIFYTHGSFCLLFSIAWLLFVNEGPHSRPRISLHEKQYILAKMMSSKKNSKPKKIPWKSFFTSKPVLAIAASTASVDYCSIAFTVFIPIYFSDVLNFKITSTGILTAILAIIHFFTQTAGGVVSDLILKKTTFTVGTVRKLVIGSGKAICVVSFVALGFATCETSTLAVVLMMMIAAGIGIMSLGYSVNPIDIGAHFSGLILSIVAFFSNVLTSASTILTTAIITEDSARESWQILFSVCGGVVGAALVIYVCFASGEVQPWAMVQEDDRCTEDQDSLCELEKESNPRLGNTEEKVESLFSGSSRGQGE